MYVARIKSLTSKNKQQNPYKKKKGSYPDLEILFLNMYIKKYTESPHSTDRKWSLGNMDTEQHRKNQIHPTLFLQNKAANKRH